MYQVIVNPSARSGRGRRNWERVKTILDGCGVDYDVHFTSKHGDAANYAKELYEACQATNTRLHLMILGGDGTLNEVIQGLPSFENVCISCIPVGSSNDLARAIGISFTPEEAVLHILNQPTTLFMDVGVVHLENSLVREGNMTIPDRRFLVSSGVGYDASICHEALESNIKNFLNKLGLGKLSYLAICLKQLIAMKPVTAELSLDDDDTIIPIEKLIFIAAMNNLYEGGGFMFAPEANNHDGIMDIVFAANISKPRLLKILPTALKGEQFKYEGTHQYKAYKCSIRTSRPLWIHTDGEVETKADFIEYQTLKEAIRIIY